MNASQLFWGTLLLMLAAGLLGAVVGIMAVRAPDDERLVRSVGAMLVAVSVIFAISAPLWAAGLQ